MEIEEMPPELDTSKRSDDVRFNKIVEGRTNSQRSARAESTLKGSPAKGDIYLTRHEDPMCATVDLVCDLIHYCRKNKIDFRKVLRMAADSHEAERCKNG